jgi:hypothetical protein
MQNEGECWILEYIFLRGYPFRILILHFIICSSYTQYTFVIQGNIVILFMYCYCTNYIDPPRIITIVLMFWLYFIFFLIDGFVFSVFDSRC